ncbi:hypothetical protein [Merismopedia glauca]|uniref:Chemotaxis protein n=1 Tax=Merismopedia glauca CCAP 1448/3 TaxID=1296344 RepID=A0A2T1C4S5_9CYAN|nr:hypothetical protein [Merismopedia glauca]PSB03282.1 hypothetical protein C7B64_09310 [Merismopedia glauca CCAP 1448/3]
MIFIIPIILGALAVGSAAVGAFAGIDAVSQMDEAKKRGKSAQKRLDSARQSVEVKVKATNDLAEEYGQLQIKTKVETIGSFVDLLERLGQRVKQSNLEFLNGLEDISPQQLKEYKSQALEAQELVSGGLKAIGTAYGVGQSTIGLVGLFGTASTGTAIGGLSGAAAWNATLAWLGGGSLAAGGGGMALGTLVLGGITVGPALLIGGFILSGEAEKALTKAREYEAQVNIEVSKLDAFRDFLDQVQQRIRELEYLVYSLNARAIQGLIDLESQPFDFDRDGAKLQRVVLLVKALSEIMKTPVLDSDGTINLLTENLKVKYGTI